MRLLTLLLAVATPAVSLSNACAQGLATPPAVTLAPPAPIGTGPGLNAPAPAAPRVTGGLPSSPMVPRVPSTGPAAASTIRPAVLRTEPTAPRTRQPVLDERGRPLTGTVPVAPDRVLDPATGRYYPVAPPVPPRP
ncbi:MAG TPA: hypothetical protein VLK29_10810 [Luteimonas sp.]|nr:hypothetical protein [Luteimonas sp.]